ncbi:methyltransferase-domain-containing protein [Xylaria intraflava]|nr:methyltransferase-domain-containing protein [Xylaria intraflava]
MFAVPGWAVSTDGPKAETAVKATQAPKEPSALGKRKRQSAPANVTANNVADLWEQIIEGKQHKKSKPERDESGGNAGDKETPAPHTAPRLTLKDKKKLKKQKAKEESEKIEQTEQLDGNKLGGGASNEAKGERGRKNHSKSSRVVQDDNSLIKTSALTTPKLTPMQAAMKEKLVSARFRHLNETLYTKPSTEAFQLFQDSPEMFQEYHEGFRRQVNVWPENPVDDYIEDIKQRGRQRHQHKSKPKEANSTAAPRVHPLVRTNGVCTIADLGCGDAKLATMLQPEKKKLNLNILSYDLQSPSTLVTKADIANLPLPDGSVDVAVFCLALMGTNWLDFIEEAYRILHWKGELWVAEIKSRFGHVRNKTTKAPVSHSVGNRKKNQGKQKSNDKGKGAEFEENHDADLAVEVDGGEDRRQETDVTAFVEALRRRGFVLQGDEKTAIDMKNKMFVKMHFIKAAQPSAGKGGVDATDPGRGGKKRGGIKFIDIQEQDGVDESRILKPSVYKVR